MISRPRPRVLIFIEVGDSSRYWEAALPRLRARGLDVTLGTLGPEGPLHTDLEKQGIETFALSCRTRNQYVLAAVPLAARLALGRFDLIHSHEAIPAAIAGLSAKAAGRGAGRLFHRHHARSTGAHAAASKMAARLAHRVVAVSDAVAAYALELDGIPAAKVCTAYNGIKDLRFVPPTQVAELRASLGVPATSPIVTIVARLRREKGHLALFEAVSRLEGRFDAQPWLLVVGDGPERHGLQRIAGEMGLACRFVGHQEDVAPWYAVSDAVAVPSLMEPFGLTAIEALASRKPLVASRVDGLAEIVQHGISGLLVRPGDPGVLSGALFEILTQPQTAERLATGGRSRYLEAFTLDHMVEGWIHAYQMGGLPLPALS